MDGQAGQTLRAERLAQALSLEQVSRATHIRVHYLEAMEAGEYHRIPSRAQARGFLRAYADFLGLNPAPFLASLEAAQAPGSREGQASNLPPRKASPGKAEKAAAAPRASSSQAATPPKQPVYLEQPVVEEIESEAAQAIFRKVGQTLKTQRELLGLSLEDVVRHTHLRLHYLDALEAGNLKDLPSPVQGRGMLKNYAVFLGLDPEPLLLRFAEGLQARLAFKQAAAQPQEAAKAPERKPAPPRPPLAIRRLFSSDLMVGGMLALFLISFMVWGAVRIFSLRSEAVVTATAPSIAEVLIEGQQTATATLEPLVETEAVVPPGGVEGELPPNPVDTEELPLEDGTPVDETPPPPAAGQGGAQVYITVSQRAWMRVTVDGRVEFEGRVIPGSAYTFAGERQVELLTGNAAALRIFFNQQDLGPLGNYGEVVNQIYSPDGILSPTPSITPTGTATPRFTATPRPTGTPRPGDTPVVPALP